MPLTVKINAVAARVTENAVDNYAYSLRLGSFNQMFKIFIRAENRIDFVIIARVVMVITFRFKDGVKINYRNSQVFEIIEFAFNTAQISAVKIIRDNFISVGVFVISGLIFPACMVDRAFFRDNFISRATKPVRENLIHNRMFEPVGSFRAFSVNGNLESGRRIIKIKFADSAELFGVVAVIISALSRHDYKIIPNQAAFVGHGNFCGVKFFFRVALVARR